MAGLLDEIFGTDPSGPKAQAMNALAAGLMSNNPGMGFVNANQAFAQAPELALKQKMQQLQLANMQSEIDARGLKAKQDARQQDLIASLFNGSPQGQQAPQGAQNAPGGQPAPGVGGAMPNAPTGGVSGAAQDSQTLMGLSKQLGIPPQVIQADIVFNGGKKISEMLADRSKPNWQNINGNLVNTNAAGFQGGFQPGMAASANGPVMAWQPDGKGGLVVGAPAGALDTYGAYQNVEQRTKAAMDPTTVTPAGQQPQMTTRAALVDQLNTQRVNPAVQGERDQERGRILQGELTKATNQYNAALQMGDQSGAARAQGDIASLRRELGGVKASVGMPLASEADTVRAKQGAEGDVKANEARAKDVKTAQQFLSVANQAGKVLSSGPTSSGIGSAIDSGAALFGVATPGSVSAQQLKALGGWLTANVPRMEGPQSNFDVGNYQRMAADVGNDMLPIARRQAALTTIQQMMKNVVDSSGQPANMPNNGVTGEWQDTGKKSSIATGGWSATLKR